jgi:hypothetical protein
LPARPNSAPDVPPPPNRRIVPTVSRYTYELARDREHDTDSTEEEFWHIVRIDDADDPPHLHTLCNRRLEEPVTRWRDYSVQRMVDIICHQCLTGYVAEAGSQAG